MSYVSEDDMKDMENMIKDVTLLKPRLIATEMRQKEMSGIKARTGTTAAGAPEEGCSPSCTAWGIGTERRPAC